MDRRSDYNQQQRSGSSRYWSDEAVRGSWDSNYQRTSATSSPRDQASNSYRRSPNAHDRNQTMVNQWLGQQYNQEPTHTMDAVSDLTTPTTSPAISDSATFPSRTAESYHTHAVSHDFLAPPSTTRTSIPHRSYHDYQQHHHHHHASTSSRDPVPRTMDYRTVDYRQAEYPSAEQDLRGVGAFADTDSSRRRVKYKPLSNWFGLWLPPHE
ncbi:hypothetical protein FDECE_1004 [Fusarium decemcellulare]|nr:hypothetical protein FDECE_1004 [Fusarium decemcellulare]